MGKRKNNSISLSISDYLAHLEKKPKGFVYNQKHSAPKKSPQAPSKKRLLEELNSKYINCQECPLSQQGRTQVVFGHGNPEASLVFVGEGPGREEDKQGYPFVGRSGQLFTKIIEAIDMKREEIYISNVVKCRPPNNRAPQPNESNLCKNLILFKEIEIIQPKIICTLGATATQALLGNHIRITRARGQFVEFQNTLLMPTYHPAYLLRNPSEKRSVWEDMKKIRSKLKELTP